MADNRYIPSDSASDVVDSSVRSENSIFDVVLNDALALPSRLKSISAAPRLIVVRFGQELNTLCFRRKTELGSVISVIAVPWKVWA